jgi:RNA polymerase sigma factor (sigma-70 family)
MSESSEPEAESRPVLLSSPSWQVAYRKYRRFWLNLARGQRISEDEAEDILHTIFCSIISDDRKQFKSVEHVRNYVTRAILNRSIEARKEAARKSPWTEFLERQHPDPGDGEAETIALRQAMREGLRGLSSAAFQIIKLRFFAGLTFAEISQLLNVPMSTIKSREEAAIKKIRASLRKKGY